MFSKKINNQNIKFIVFLVLLANIIHVSLGHTADNSTKTTEVIFEADTTNYSIMQDLNSKITSKGNIDILINGSGINSSSDFLDI